MKHIKKFCSVILASMLACTILPSGAFAAEEDPVISAVTDAEFLTIQSEADDFLSMIEAELSLHGTCVVDELEKQAEQYTNMLPTCSEDDESKLISLIETTNQLIEDYVANSNGNISRGSYHVIYSAEVAGCIAVFKQMGYDFAAELLTHSKDNDELDSYYTPVCGNQVTSSKVYVDEVLNSTSTSSSAAFTKLGLTDDDDLYYALHRFNYRKSNSGSVVVIEDRYDYEQGSMGSGITGMVVNQMYKAQEAGVIVPYYTYIVIDTGRTSRNQAETVSINSISSNRMFSEQVVLGKGEYKDFTITFNTSGNKLFQTFGPHDTQIEIFNSQGTSLTNGKGDDYGYKSNAMIKYYCTAGTKYTVRVKFYSASKSGDFIFAVTPAQAYFKTGLSALNTYNDIFTFDVADKYTLTSNTLLNQTGVVTFTPKATADYDIQISSNYDTYMYIIDPRSSREWQLNVDFNDDSGEGANPKISRRYASGVPYLIVYSGFNIANSSTVGEIKILFDKTK